MLPPLCREHKGEGELIVKCQVVRWLCLVSPCCLPLGVVLFFLLSVLVCSVVVCQFLIWSMFAFVVDLHMFAVVCVFVFSF